MAGSHTAPNPYLDPAHVSVSTIKVGRRGGDRPVRNALPSAPANRPPEVAALYPITDPTKAGDLPPDVVANMEADLAAEQAELAALGLVNPFMTPTPTAYDQIGNADGSPIETAASGDPTEAEALPEGTLVVTADGETKPIEEVESGDELMTVSDADVGSVDAALEDLPAEGETPV